MIFLTTPLPLWGVFLLIVMAGFIGMWINRNTNKIAETIKEPPHEKFHFKNADAILEYADNLSTQFRMDMKTFPRLKDHAEGCAFPASVKFLVGSVEVNERRELRENDPRHIRAAVQPATPILPCTCGLWEKGK